jgi:hypothetical protein
MIRRVLSFLLLAGSTAAFASEPVTIATLVSNGGYYDHHPVIVQGIVRHVNVFPPSGPSLSGCGVLYGAYTFTLDDGTGSIQVRVKGACVPGVVLPVTPDSRVVITGVFRAMSRGGRILALAMPQLDAHTIHQLAAEETGVRNHVR